MLHFTLVKLQLCDLKIRKLVLQSFTAVFTVLIIVIEVLVYTFTHLCSY